MKDQLRALSLISGGGSTLCYAIEKSLRGELPVTFPCVISDKPEEGGLDNVVKTNPSLAGHVYVVRRCDYPDKFAFGEAKLKIARKYAIDLITQNGWLAYTPPNVVEAYRGRIINQHPAPLDPGFPDFGGSKMRGKTAQCARLLYARATQKPEELWTCATVHRVVEKVDGGAILGERRLEILPHHDMTDKPEHSLPKALLPLEHELVVDVLRQFAEGTVKEIVREHRLISPSNLKILEDAKRAAIDVFRNG
ncbi:MAG TPA: formyltransferase family protein [Candidatus Paceibacterota bacterium]